MSDTPNDQPLGAGTYVIENGVRRLVTPPTENHPEGNRARAEDGAPIAAPDETHANPSEGAGK